MTLNVLLSFAQFEREVTGERLRDKIAASKKKRLWMGGVAPLGYRVEDRKLIVEEEEAKFVRKIFERHQELGAISALQRELRGEAVVARERRLANGKIVGGVALTNGALSNILKNRHYLGELNHHGRSWPAEHEPIVDVVLFDAMQAKLADNLNRAANRNAKSGTLLMGKIFDNRGNPMSPSHAVKKGARYRHCVSSAIAQGGKTRRAPPRESQPSQSSNWFSRNFAALEGIGVKRRSPTSLSDRGFIVGELDRLVVRAIHIEIEIRRKKETADAESDVILVDWRKPSSARRRDIILPETSDGPFRPIRVDEQARLLNGIALARRCLDELVAGTIADVSELAKREKRSERSIRMMLSLVCWRCSVAQSS